MATLETSLIGKTVDGRFSVTRHLGSGGMGTAFEALQKGLNRPVCLKFLKSDELTSLDSINRFKREARVLASLHHKNIVECFSFGIYENVYPYLALEFVRGMSLNVLAQKEDLHWTRIARLVVQVCDALEYAHNSGFIHRDVKPANVMVTRDSDGQELVKLVDFGLVGKQRGELVFDTLTDPKSILGSINYMPPEAFKGAAADVSLDVYAVGCLLYELLSGQLPFDAENPIAVMFKHAQAKLPDLPATIMPDVARHALNQLIRCATEASKSDRLKSCAEIRSRLVEILELHCSTVSIAVHGDTQASAHRSSRQSAKAFWDRSKWQWLIVIAISAILLIAICIQSNRSLVSKDNTAKIAFQQKRRAVRDQRDSVADALERFRSIVKELDSVRPAREALSKTSKSVREFLELYASALSSDDKEVQDLTRATFTRLAELQEASSETDLRKELFAQQCDVLTRFGYYEDTMALLRLRSAPDSLRHIPSLREGNLDQLARLDDFVFGFEKEAPNSFLLERLRPAAVCYTNFKDSGLRFMRLVAHLNRDQVKDHWSPRLIKIGENLSINRDEQLIAFWIDLCEIAVRSNEPELTHRLMPKIRKELTRCSVEIGERVANLYDKLNQTDEALKIIGQCSERARRRDDPYHWCLCQCDAIQIMARRGKERNAREMFRKVLRSEHWTRAQLFDRSQFAEYFELFDRYSRLAFELQEYPSVIAFYNQTMKLPSLPWLQDKRLELAAYCVEAAGRINQKQPAVLAINQQLSSATAAERLRFAVLLCERACASDTIGEPKVRIRQITQSISVLREAQKLGGELDAASVGSAKNTLLDAKIQLADALCRDKQWKEAEKVYLELTPKLGQESKGNANVKGCLLSLLHVRKIMADLQGARAVAEEILEALRRTSVWTKDDVDIFEQTLYEYWAVEALFGDLNHAVAFLDKTSNSYMAKGPQQCCLNTIAVLCQIWGPGQRRDIAQTRLQKSAAYLHSVRSPETEPEQRIIYSHLKRDTAARFSELGDLDKAQKLLSGLIREYPSDRPIDVLDAYCGLANFAYYRGDYDEALSLLSRASIISVPDLDRLIRTNMIWARILSAQGRFPEALLKLDQLRKLVNIEKNPDERQRNLILVELAYDHLYRQWHRPDDGRKHLHRAAKLFESGRNSQNVALGLDVVGEVFERLSADAEQSNRMVEAAQYLEELRNPDFLKTWYKNNFRYGTGLCYYQLAKLYLRHSQNAKALFYLSQAVRFPRAENYRLLLAEAEAAAGKNKAAALTYKTVLSRAGQLSCLNNSVQSFENARVYLSYACWLHDQNNSAEAIRYAEKALGLMTGNPAIYNRRIKGVGWIASEHDATLKNLERLARWYTADQRTLQHLLSCARSASNS